MEKATVFIDDPRDRRRFACPRGHRTWEARADDFHCRTCARAEDRDGSVAELLDLETGTLWRRSNVRVDAVQAADADGPGRTRK